MLSESHSPLKFHSTWPTLRQRHSVLLVLFVLFVLFHSPQYRLCAMCQPPAHPESHSPPKFQCTWPTLRQRLPVLLVLDVLFVLFHRPQYRLCAMCHASQPILRAIVRRNSNVHGPHYAKDTLSFLSFLSFSSFFTAHSIGSAQCTPPTGQKNPHARKKTGLISLKSYKSYVFHTLRKIPEGQFHAAVS